ncbi:H-NS histone family protein [Acinetobacter sp. C_4_1]|uniref:H-NS histone family protein n=1 Tax=unclassified Acinetobacter TaxID=196816 RepID=UPI0021B76C00|nr:MULTISPECIES: H-NS histone family protein [unclassified Acinetobacter]MCT8090287.1 H-NS histone family protein [Acinetobacter sp. F_3_1]MCT8097918.1 H-NS histone family protein [Acinetobacter sp. C_3_1]MCT8101911.1 H-NS histone family protein [Acinetobacter sp. C_4_1]MCT8135713.1 H-NS histone family protein [Acinetobacter sp. T_3_1]
MMPDISNLSVEELKRLQVEAEALIASKKDQAVEDAYQQILDIADNVGLSIEQILEFGGSKRKKSTRKSVEPRYRSKKNSADTWTGRGKQPRWLVAELESGAKLEDFLI